MPAAKESRAETRFTTPPLEKKFLASQTPNPKASRVAAVMKTRWKALSDIING